MALLDEMDFLAQSSANSSNLKLLSTMAQRETSHAFLFSGQSPKLLYRLALAFAASINCPRGGCGGCLVCANTLKGVHRDLLVVEAEGNFLIGDDVASIKKFVSVTPNAGTKKIVIIKEAETMNDAFANKFLKTLEEPPDEDCVFILLAPSPKRLLATITSRCMEFVWDFLPGGPEISCLDLNLIENVLHSKMKKMVEGDRKEALAAAPEICGVLEDFSAAIKKGFEKDLEAAKNNRLPKEAKALSQIQQRRLARLNKLGMGAVFDIIVAWLEDILAVRSGAGSEALNYKGNHSFIDANIFDIDFEKISSMLWVIENNRAYIDRSINMELALDNIFLNLSDILRGDT